MTNVTIAEKQALESVFIVLEERRNQKIKSVLKYIMFYRNMKMFSFARN